MNTPNNNNRLERDKSILSMYNAGISVEDIATEVGISPRTVSGKLSAFRGLGLVNRPKGRPGRPRGTDPKTKIRDIEFAKAYDAGDSIEELADKFELALATTKNYVYRLRRIGLITRRDQRIYERPAQDRDSEIASRVNSGQSVDDVASAFSLSSARVQQIVYLDSLRKEVQEPAAL